MTAFISWCDFLFITLVFKLLTCSADPHTIHFEVVEHGDCHTYGKTFSLMGYRRAVIYIMESYPFLPGVSMEKQGEEMKMRFLFVVPTIRGSTWQSNDWPRISSWVLCYSTFPSEHQPLLKLGCLQNPTLAHLLSFFISYLARPSFIYFLFILIIF